MTNTNTQKENILDFDYENNFTINNEIINDAVYEDEFLEYQPAFLEDFVNELINWTSEASERDNGEFELMKADLLTLMNKDNESSYPTFFLNSNSTNSYLFKGDAKYDEVLSTIYALNKAIKQEEK